MNDAHATMTTAAATGAGRLGWIVRGVTTAFALMVLLGLAALQFTAVEPPVPLIWPAAGVALALTFRYGWPAAIGTALGAAILHNAIGTPLGPALALGVITGAAGIASAMILRRLRFDPTFRRVRDAILLLAVGGGLTAVLSAVGGAMVVTGLTPDFAATFGLCWIADAMGMILLAPPLLALRTPHLSTREALEAGAWVIAGVLFVYGVYAGGLSAPIALAASYAVFPLVLAVALRFGAAITGITVAALAAVALVCTGLDKGPFAQTNMIANLLSLHAHLAMLGVTGLVLAAARTERDAADEQAREHLRTLARAGRIDAMSSMAAGIAHEVNQPLSAVNSYAHAAQRMLRDGRTPGEIGDALERVVKGNERAAAIVRRVRTFLRTGDGERARADLNTLACEAIELSVPEYRRQGVSLISDRASRPLMVEVDPVAIRQVVVNLLQNALEAVHESSGENLRWVRVKTRAIETSHEAELTVEDSGPGLPAEERHHLFEPLVTGRSGGTGLGLAIVRSLIEAHGGTVDAGDAEDGGALFRIRIPTAARQTNREAA